MLNQLGYLLVFVLSSWLNGAPQAPWFTFVFGGLFAMHSHLFGEIMDYGPDLSAGRRTTAGALGIRSSKALMTAFLACESALLLAWARDVLLAAFLAGGAIWFALDRALLWRDRPYSGGQMRFFLLGWNAAALVGLPVGVAYGDHGEPLIPLGFRGRPPTERQTHRRHSLNTRENSPIIPLAFPNASA